MRPVARLALVLLLASCGDDFAPEVEVPQWAHVAPEQIAEAAKHRVPVAFENDLGMRFVLVPAGTFKMGSREEEERRYSSKPQHEVTLTRPFYVQVTEVSNQVYRRLRPDHDAEERTRNAPRLQHVWTARSVSVYPGWYGPELNEALQPVTCVTWQEAEAFAEWLSGQDGRRTYRLPTEAEWEYACRAGTTTHTAFGETLTREQARTGPERFETRLFPPGWCNPGEVGSRRPNRWGIHDMHGNVFEWCADWFAAYGPDPVEDPKGPPEGTRKILRGGDARTAPSYVGSAERWSRPPEYVTGWGRVGFRLVSPLPEREE